MVAVLPAGDAAASPVEVDGKHPSVEIAKGNGTQELRLRDGSLLYGRVRSVDGDQFVFETVSGRQMALALSEVAELREVRGRVVEGEFRTADPNATRLFFAPTG